MIAALATASFLGAVSPGAGLPADRDRAVALSASDATDWSAAKRRKRPRRPQAAPTSRGQGQIACPRGGCRPVPPGCGAVSERDLDDNPTGYEIIVCPRR